MKQMESQLQAQIEAIFCASKFTIEKQRNGMPHKKNVNFKSNNGPDVTLQIDKSSIILWIGCATLPSVLLGIEHLPRVYGFQKNGNPAPAGRSGFHTGVEVFLGKGPHIQCFPCDLAEVSTIVRALS